ncbi:rimI: ribosomal-protein-alanine acetyltransferase [Lysobacter silvestris]|uniref:[Ribosomal protein bS18]-alanine N-acetyltransferase n=2 Tax=Solilutibacter silvestris TaxID=1645665 RepID=A0A2K1Q2I2_9GAMM|nr:ribosomal protein S18-alanine N-acetyltransferase [Lysobacter silvestris]PNS09244.1 rimI: ribosomal-protein-alanine acetyltransferase [Lysobacter silvestris]
MPAGRLRPIRESDLDAVMAVEERGYPHPWSRAVFRDCLRAGYSAWMLEDGVGEVLGYGVLSHALDECHLLNLCVDPRVQSRGVGRSLLMSLLQLARARGARQMFLEVRPSNTRAVALYHDIGFNEIGRRPRYYPAANGQREDAIVMAMELLD